MHSLCDDMHFCSLTTTVIEVVAHRSGCCPQYVHFILQFLHVFSCRSDDWPLHGDGLLRSWACRD